MVVRRWLLFRRTVGFYVTCFVQAGSDELARERALSEVRDEPRLLLAAIRPPSLAVEEVEVVDLEGAPLPKLGIVFYPADARS